MDEHFRIGERVSTDDPFPLPALGLSSKVGPGGASSDNTAASLVALGDDRVFYSYWNLGQAGTPFGELDANVLDHAAPAAALVGPNHEYLFVVVTDKNGNLQINQGHLGRPFVGWGEWGSPDGAASAKGASR